MSEYSVSDVIPDRLECKFAKWGTPEYVLKAIRDLFGGPIKLDPATEPGNPTGALRFFDREANGDGLAKPWEDGTFVNPPYGEEFPRWMEKLYLETSFRFRTCALLPCGARFSTKRFQRCVLNTNLTAICFVDHRIAFLRDGVPENDNIYDSAIYCYHIDPDRAAKCLGALGRVLKVEVLR